MNAEWTEIWIDSNPADFSSLAAMVVGTLIKWLSRRDHLRAEVPVDCSAKLLPKINCNSRGLKLITFLVVPFVEIKSAR